VNIEMIPIEKGLPERCDSVLLDTGKWYAVGYYGGDRDTWDEKKGRFKKKCWYVGYGGAKLKDVKIVSWGYLPYQRQG
jgi:hypothetical protein